MTRAKAIEIVNDLKNQNIEPAEKMEAIVEVSQLATHNGVTKAALVESLRFTLEVMKSVLSSDDAEAES